MNGNNKSFCGVSHFSIVQSVHYIDGKISVRQ